MGQYQGIWSRLNYVGFSNRTGNIPRWKPADESEHQPTSLHIPGPYLPAGHTISATFPFLFCLFIYGLNIFFWNQVGFVRFGLFLQGVRL